MVQLNYNSDNCSAAAPEVMKALVDCNAGEVRNRAKVFERFEATANARFNEVEAARQLIVPAGRGRLAPTGRTTGRSRPWRA
jgi:hypothetical protein